jgi:hypothetical protein
MTRALSQILHRLFIHSRHGSRTSRCACSNYRCTDISPFTAISALTSWTQVLVVVSALRPHEPSSVRPTWSCSCREQHKPYTAIFGSLQTKAHASLRTSTLTRLHFVRSSTSLALRKHGQSRPTSRTKAPSRGYSNRIARVKEMASVRWRSS